MKTSTSGSKQISALWFYLFAVLFGSLGITLFVKPDPTLSPVFRFAYGLISLFVGLSFLLEPLHRIGKLPKFIDQGYEVFTIQFGQRQGLRKTKSFVLFFATAGMVAFLSSDGAFGPAWTTIRIYMVGLIAVYAAFFFMIALCNVFYEWGPARLRQSRFVSFVILLPQMDADPGRRMNPRAVSNFAFSILLFTVGFYVTLSIREGSIFGPLALAFMATMSFGQSMVFGREATIRAEIETELKTAHDMQMGLMPKSDPSVNGFEISGTCMPANEVGGDYFDYVWLDQKKTKIGIAIADVSGKAMKAAITAVMTSGMIYREIGANESPKSILKKINRPMYLKTDRQVFTALSFAVIDIKKKLLTFSNAGQAQPILLRGRQLRYIKVRGARLPLGVMAEQDYKEANVRLMSGDILLFYTDGLPEATNSEHQLLGFEAVEQELVYRRTGSAAEIVRSMTELVSRHTGKTEQHDDMTVVVVRVL